MVFLKKPISPLADGSSAYLEVPRHLRIGKLELLLVREQLENDTLTIASMHLIEPFCL